MRPATREFYVGVRGNKPMPPGNKALRTLIFNHLPSYNAIHTLSGKRIYRKKLLREWKSLGGCFKQASNATVPDVTALKVIDRIIRDLQSKSPEDTQEYLLGSIPVSSETTESKATDAEATAAETLVIISTQACRNR